MVGRSRQPFRIEEVSRENLAHIRLGCTRHLSHEDMKPVGRARFILGQLTQQNDVVEWAAQLLAEFSLCRGGGLLAPIHAPAGQSPNRRAIGMPHQQHAAGLVKRRHDDAVATRAPYRPPATPDFVSEPI